MVGAVFGTQSWVSMVKSRGLNTPPCGAPALSVVVLDVLLSIITDSGLSVRKSSMQLQREVFRPNRCKLMDDGVEY